MKKIILALALLVAGLSCVQAQTLSQADLNTLNNSTIRTGLTAPKVADFNKAMNESTPKLLGSYANPAWISSLAGSKITGLTNNNFVLGTGTGLASSNFSVNANGLVIFNNNAPTIVDPFNTINSSYVFSERTTLYAGAGGGTITDAFVVGDFHQLGDNVNYYSGTASFTYAVNNNNFAGAGLVGGAGAQLDYGGNGPSSGGIAISLDGNGDRDDLTWKYVRAVGGAVNISHNTTSQTTGHGAMAAQSFILGTENGHIPSSSPRSMLLSGQGMTARASDPDQVYVPNFNILTTPLGDNTLAQIMVRDPSTGQIKSRDALTLGRIIVDSNYPSAVANLKSAIDIKGPGQVTLTNGSATITGVGTTFTDATAGVGLSYWFNFWVKDSGGTWFQVQINTITNNTSATIFRCWNETTWTTYQTTNRGSFTNANGSTTFSGITGTYDYYPVLNFSKGNYTNSLGNSSYNAGSGFNTSFGGKIVNLGQGALASGFFNYIDPAANYSLTIGRTNTVKGAQSITGGNDNLNEGNNSFNIGTSNLLQSGANNSAILGGQAITLSAAQTVAVPKLRVGLGTSGALSATTNNSAIIARNTSTGELEIRTVTTNPWALSEGGNGVALIDPNANKVKGWDDTDNTIGFWTLDPTLKYTHSSHTLSVNKFYYIKRNDTTNLKTYTDIRSTFEPFSFGTPTGLSIYTESTTDATHNAQFLMGADDGGGEGDFVRITHNAGTEGGVSTITDFAGYYEGVKVHSDFGTGTTDFNISGLQITDNRAVGIKHGLEYVADYSSVFSVNSLITSNWVTNIAHTYNAQQNFITTSSYAGIRMQFSGTPSSPVDGEIWPTGSHLVMRIGSVTAQLDHLGLTSGVIPVASTNGLLVNWTDPNANAFVFWDDTDNAHKNVTFTGMTYDHSTHSISVNGGAPFSDATALIKNSSDNTKQILISAAGIGSGTTRTYTAPSWNGQLLVSGGSVILGGSDDFGFFTDTGGKFTLSSGLTGTPGQLVIEDNAGTKSIKLTADNNTASLTANTSGIKIRSGSASVDLDFNGDAILTDFRGTAKGFEYAGTGYVTQTHSLTDKEYVDDVFSTPITVVTTTTTLTTSHNVVLVDASGGAVTINLPAASSNNEREYVIKKVDSSGNSVTVDGNASEQIDAALTSVLSAQHKFIKIKCRSTAFGSTNWFIISSN